MRSINVDTQRQANGTHAQALVDFTLPVSLAQGQYRIVGNLFDDYASNGFAPGFYDRSEGNGGDDNALGIKFTLEQDARVSLNISSSGYFAPDGTRIAANNIGGRYLVIFAADRSLFVGGTTLDNGPSTAPWQFFQSTLHNGNSFTLKAGDYVFWNLQGVASQYTQTFDFNSRDFYMNFDLTFNIVLSSTISITAASANKAEGNAGATPFTFTVNRTGDLSGASSAAWAVSGSGVTAADFAGGALPTGTVSFAAGETSTTITVNVLGDSTIEPDEGFTVTLSTPSAGTTITTATATGTILNDDSEIAIAALSANKAEGNSGSTPFTFTVTRSGDTTGTSTANWAVSGSGVTAADFAGGALPTGTVSFAAGETSKTITVNVAGDTDIEPDEGFTVTLSAPTGAALATAVATGTIRNDDAIIALSGGATIAEGNSGGTAMTFTVTRSGDTTSAVSASYAVTGSGGSPANASDFVGGVLPSGTVSFAAGETSRTITVTIAGDTAVEPDEGFTIALSAPAGATLGAATASGTIANDDAIVGTIATIGYGTSVVDRLEGNSGVTSFDFIVLRSGDLSRVVEANWAVSSFTSVSLDGANFAGGVVPSGRVTFSANETSKTVTVSVAGDTVVEPDLRFEFALSPVFLPGGGQSAAIADGFATGIVRNDDVPGLIGTDGADTLNGTADNETISGLGGNDSLLGGLGNDTLSGGAGDDTLVGGSGADSLVGGSGNDTVSYASDAAGVTLRLDLGSGTDGGGSTDNFTGIEGVIGSGFNDVITGMVGITNFIDAGAGNDVVFGGDRAETILGGNGDDVILAGNVTLADIYALFVT